MKKNSHSRPPRSAFRPLRVTAHLAAPIASDFMIPLDGVLYYHAMREQHGVQEFTQPGQDHAVRATAVSLPFLRHREETPQWFYACSWAQWPERYASGMTHWNKRLDVPEARFLESRSARIDTKSGRYKAYHMPLYYRHARSVFWWVVADPQWLRRMLGWVVALGKKTQMGWGAVSRWEVAPAPADYSIRDAAGELVRAVPSAAGTAHMGYRPSYWLPKNQALCELPKGTFPRLGDE